MNQDHLFTSDLMALRKRRANVASAIRCTREAQPWIHTPTSVVSRLLRQYQRTFYYLTVIELQLTDKVSA